jgi:hypothetical protein
VWSQTPIESTALLLVTILRGEKYLIFHQNQSQRTKNFHLSSLKNDTECDEIFVSKSRRSIFKTITQLASLICSILNFFLRRLCLILKILEVSRKRETNPQKTYEVLRKWSAIPPDCELLTISFLTFPHLLSAKGVVLSKLATVATH